MTKTQELPGASSSGPPPGRALERSPDPMPSKNNPPFPEFLDQPLQSIDQRSLYVIEQHHLRPIDQDTFEKLAFPYNKAKTEIQVNEDERKQKHDAWKLESELEINDQLYIRHRGLKCYNKIQGKWKPKYIYHCWKTV